MAPPGAPWRLLLSASLILPANAITFAHFDHTYARSILQWWKPQSTPGRAVHAEDPQRFARASTCLADSATSGILSSRLSLFVVRVDGRQCEVHACLWRPDKARVEELRRLRSWIRSQGLEDIAILEGDDELCWDLSEFYA